MFRSSRGFDSQSCSIAAVMIVVIVGAAVCASAGFLMLLWNLIVPYFFAGASEATKHPPYIVFVGIVFALSVIGSLLRGGGESK